MSTRPGETINDKKWERAKKRAYKTAKRRKKKTLKEILRILNTVDNIELISRLTLISQFGPRGTAEHEIDINEIPLLTFLVGLCLKNQPNLREPPTDKDIGRIITSGKEYFQYLRNELIFESSISENVTPETDLIFRSKMQNMLRQVNREFYGFQIPELIRYTYGSIDDFFEYEHGFTVSEALTIQERIVELYEKRVNEKIKWVKEKTKEELKRGETKEVLERIIKEKAVDKADIEARYAGYLFYSNAKGLLLFEPKDLILNNKNKENSLQKTEHYLEAFSCEIGSQYEFFKSPLDENIFFTKPLIKLNEKEYFAPIPNNLIHKLPSMFYDLLKKERGKKSPVWHRFEKARAEFAEKKSVGFFATLFTETNVYRNLYYEHSKARGVVQGEIDLLIIYDNKIVLGEIKTGVLTSPAKRGALKRLKTDLRKLVEDAYTQIKLAKEYIFSADSVSFYDRKNEKILEIRKNEITDVFLINITLEPLYDFGVRLKDLRDLGLFKENEFPWSVNLSNLEIITTHSPSPAVFFHYLERSREAQDENQFYAMDELTLFAWYLKRGNFYLERLDNGELADFILISPDFLQTFDDHYLFDGPPPEFELEEEYVEMINFIEREGIPGFTNIISALLDIDRGTRNEILKGIKTTITKTRRDKKNHDFSLVYRAGKVNMGITFLASFGRLGLREKLSSYCHLKKYKEKKYRWLGFGRDVSDSDWFINEFVVLDYPWKRDGVLDRIAREYPSAGTKLRSLDEIK